MRALGQIHGSKFFGSRGAKHQGTEGGRAGEIIADAVAGRIFAGNCPLLLRIDGRLVVAPGGVGQIKPSVQEPFIQKPDPPGIPPGWLGANDSLDLSRGDNSKQTLQDCEVKSFIFKSECKMALKVR